MDIVLKLTLKQEKIIKIMKYKLYKIKKNKFSKLKNKLKIISD